MANYPSYEVSIDSTPDPESGVDDHFSQPGIQHSRIMHGQQYYRFDIVHPDLSWAEWIALRDLYLAGPRDVYTYTHYDVSPAETYSVKFLAPPRITENHGDDGYRVAVRLRGYKD